MHQESLVAVAERFAELERLERLKDFTITHGDRTWKVHRTALVVHSAVLTKACAGNFEEAKKATIDLSADPETAVAALVEYLYAFDYTTNVQDGGPISFHVSMFILADKYDIQPLKSLATDKFEHAMRPHRSWGNGVKKRLKTGDTIPVERRKDVVEDQNPQPEDVAYAIKLAYEARAVTKERCIDLVEWVAGSEDVLIGDSGSDAIEGAIESIPGFAVDIARALRFKSNDAYLPVV
ncbi:hypothetical protein TI39_contig5839g00029 [Lecanosticta acicola]|uniref:BTB domain-containing protein n=1 Tax=Lecanosticta acicola TaxID=111012 RepID=A0AAI8Z692_9PEZI|nr:hypothetical protein TI39_contig5839g00029 [Lecanosticta acicola]